MRAANGFFQGIRRLCKGLNDRVALCALWREGSLCSELIFLPLPKSSKLHDEPKRLMEARGWKE